MHNCYFIICYYTLNFLPFIDSWMCQIILCENNYWNPSSFGFAARRIILTFFTIYNKYKCDSFSFKIHVLVTSPRISKTNKRSIVHKPKFLRRSIVHKLKCLQGSMVHKSKCQGLAKQTKSLFYINLSALGGGGVFCMPKVYCT